MLQIYTSRHENRSRPRQMQSNDCFPSTTVDPRTSSRKTCKGRNDLRFGNEKEERRVLASTKVKKPAVIRKRKIMSWDIESRIIHGPLALRRASRQTLSCLVRSISDMFTREQSLTTYLHLFNSRLELAGDFCGSLPIFRGF
jgi:hypothetical protein